MFGNFTEETRKIMTIAQKEMNDLKHPYVGSEHLFLAILKTDNSVSKRLKSYGLDYEKFREKLISIVGTGTKESEFFLYTPLVRRIIENAIVDSKENNNEVSIESLFYSILDEGEGVAIEVINSLDIDTDELYNNFNNKNRNTRKNKKLTLEELGTDLTKKAANGELDPVIGREEEIKRVMEILSRRTKNNPLLIGEAGVGKTAIVEELSRLIAIGEVPISLKNKRIISMDMASVVAGTKYRGEFEERMYKILKEIEENPDIILFIDEIHTLVGAGGAEGAIDASNIFKPALSRNKLRCIGATTTLEYKKHIENDKALDRRFQKVNIERPAEDVLTEILIKLRPIYEKYHSVLIDDEILNLIVDLSNKYIYDREQPDKAIDILDEVCAKVSLKETKDLTDYNNYIKKMNDVIKKKNEAIINNDFKMAANYKEIENNYISEVNKLEINMYKKEKVEVTKEDVAAVVSIKTKIPVYELLEDNNLIINEIESELKSEIVGQDNVIADITKITKMIKMGFKEDSKPYSMIFCGPSGVGKTKLAGSFGKIMVGYDNVIKLDMSEYREAHTISKILGSPPGYVGYSDCRNLLEEIRNKPHSVLILDEIEKANESVVNIFFQILDEGKIKDSKGNLVRFDNVTIIFTSNIGFHDINIGFSQNKDSVNTKLKENFSVPFINRIDNILIFNKLDEKSIRTLIEQKVNNLKSKYSRKKIEFNLTENVLNTIVKMSKYDEFGARKIDSIIKNQVETKIIDEYILGKKLIEIENLEEVVN